MIKKNYKDVGFVYKGTQVIDKIYKGTDLVFEQGYTREQTGVPPITTTYQAIGKNLKDYKIYGNSIRGKLPSEYQQVEYIESTGTQYINTQISSNINIETEIDVQFTQDSTSAQILIWISSSGGQWAGQVNKKYGLGGGIGFNIISTIRKLVKISFSANNSTQTVNMEIDGNVISRNGTVPPATNYKIFKTDTYGSYARIYSAIIKENDVILRKYIPCYRKSDNVIGMYDLVTNTFFTNAGTGVFLKGSNAPTPTAPIEIESVGDLVTDTNDVNYGKYKIPVKVKDTNNIVQSTINIYLDEPLRKVGDYSDYIDFGNSKVIRNNKEYNVTGQESILIASDGYIKSDATDGYIILNDINDGNLSTISSLCNQLEYSNIAIWSRVGYANKMTINRTQFHMNIENSLLGITNYQSETISTAKGKITNYLQNKYSNGNPIKVLYPLQIPIEESITLPNIPTIKGTTIFEIDTNINASNMYIKYKSK